jgi:GT2 family glycosyltransferase
MTAAASDRPLISVVIPTHQRAALLERCLDSLKEQTLARAQFEVVVVDDGSTDETKAVCERFAEGLPLVYFRIENSGISAAKNLGLFASQSPLVLFFDDDDLADAAMLEAHVEAHRAHPEENVAVLGYTTWAEELEVTPVMHHVTEVGQQMFFYKGIEDGAMLDHTFFWGGRSSCKRSFLAQYGAFDQDFPAIIEDIELGFRLARHGFSVFHTRAAKSFMVRPVTYDEFAARCVKRGRALWLFADRHAEAAVKSYCRVEEALERWPALQPALEAKMDRVRELEHEPAPLGPEELTELDELYRWTFEALQVRGIVEAEAENSETARASSRVMSGGATHLPPICPDPVFIIGSPRSGTTVLGQALAEHSALWTSGESYMLFHLFREAWAEQAFDRSMEVPGPRWLRVEGVGKQEYLAYIGMGLNALYTSRSGGLRWLDHTPLYTYVADTLADLFPGARFIHLLRDGREVVNSMVRFAGAATDAEIGDFLERTVAWSTDMRSACEAWREHVDVATAFCDEHPDRATVVRHEDLVAAPEATCRDIHRFLGITDEGGPGRFLTSRRVNSSYGEGPRPSAVQLWEGWDEESRRAFAEIAGPAMVEHGYATPEDLGGLADAAHVAG